MKLSELKPCAVCDGKITPVWYVLRVSQAMLKPNAANEVLGLTQMFGGSLGLAEVMSSDPDCVMIFGDAEASLMTEIHICHDCFLMKPLHMAMLLESQRYSSEPPPEDNDYLAAAYRKANEKNEDAL